MKKTDNILGWVVNIIAIIGWIVNIQYRSIAIWIFTFGTIMGAIYFIRTKQTSFTVRQAFYLIIDLATIYHYYVF